MKKLFNISAALIFSLTLLSSMAEADSEKNTYFGTDVEKNYISQLHQIKDLNELNRQMGEVRTQANISCVGKKAIEIVSFVDDQLRLSQAVEFLSYQKAAFLKTFGFDQNPARSTNLDHGFSRLMRRYFEVENQQCFVNGMKLAAGLDEIKDRIALIRERVKSDLRQTYAGRADKPQVYVGDNTQSAQSLFQGLAR